MRHLIGQTARITDIILAGHEDPHPLAGQTVKVIGSWPGNRLPVATESGHEETIFMGRLAFDTADPRGNYTDGQRHGARDRMRGFPSPLHSTASTPYEAGYVDGWASDERSE